MFVNSQENQTCVEFNDDNNKVEMSTPLTPYLSKFVEWTPVSSVHRHDPNLTSPMCKS